MSALIMLIVIILVTAALIAHYLHSVHQDYWYAGFRQRHNQLIMVTERALRRRVSLSSNEPPLWSGPPEVVSYIPEHDGWASDPIKIAVREAKWWDEEDDQ